MSRKKVIGFVAALALCVTSASLQAGVIFDSNTTANSLIYSDSDGPFTQFIANDFILSAGQNTITDVHWTGAYDSGNTPPALDDFTIQIFADNAGAPNVSALHSLSVGHVDRIDTGNNNSSGLDVYSYSANISAITLTANTTFWLSIFNDTSGVSDIWGWGGRYSSGLLAGFRTDQVSPWSTFGGEVDFQLTDDGVTPSSPVTEPSTLLLMGLGLAGLAYSRRRKGLVTTLV